jgi:hypothetical protein
MLTDIQLCLLAALLFQLKHWLFDFLLQTEYQLRNKGKYGHPGGILHAGGHALGSLPILFVIAPGMGWILGLAAAEFVVHYHCDWVKERMNRRQGWSVENRSFWLALGADQAFHQLTYIAMITAALVVA